jgi:site-specific DNA-methyltransferase (adenine-specific)
MINFYNIDCMEFMAEKPDKFYDLAIVDPDYGLNDLLTIGGTWSAKYKNHEGRLGGKPNKKYFDELFRISINQIIWGGNYFALPKNRCFIIWDKIARMPSLSDCEYAWSSFDENAKIFSHVRNVPEKRIHITQKPVKLYRWLLQNYAKPGQKIFDSHGGSMSSAIACDMEGLDLDICEIDKDYFDAAVKRFKEYKRQLKLF